MLQVEEDFLGLHGQVLLVLRILDALDCKELSNLPLHQDDFPSEIFETFRLQNSEFVAMTSERPLNLYSSSDVNIEGVENGLLNKPRALKPHLIHLIRFLRRSSLW